MDFQVIKSLHIIFVVSWFAGLFYLVRLFIYHVEAQDEKDVSIQKAFYSQFEIMEHRLMYAITMPAMIFTLLTGAYMIHLIPGFLSPWLYLKLSLVVVLLWYHFKCIAIMKEMKKFVFKWSSYHLRLFNEVATLVLVAAVFLVVMKNIGAAMWASFGFILFAFVVFATIKLIKKSKVKKSAN